MATPQIHLSRRARQDLDEIASYLAHESETAPRRILLELWRTFEFVAANPRVGTRRDDLHPGVRVFTPPHPANSYLIFFYPCADGVEISDIIHGARDWSSMFKAGDR